MHSLYQKARCPFCGVEFNASIKSVVGDEAEVACPNGHVFTISISNSDFVLDCEIRDWERFSLLPQSTQQAVLEVIQSGRVPPDMQALMRRLRDAGVVVCT
ncbi:hypothetical protein ODS41_01535 [Pyrobaculum sp. 3827-6]|jgi:hypothetical protein|uniref:Family 562 protein n=1 Tax=Pyrobaculum ferrireducens TaxID=1104324 RepID=G7VHE0_9CREN|nr:MULTISPECIES: hypothetical protein [Pyrobaculum]AET32043.1 hypothetical protein P186_0591 [Pyrobaculum ferrireducens]MCU7786611.1 hypothetical protein [Pyrobaculum sp. 3827-6]